MQVYEKSTRRHIYLTVH